MVHRGIFEDEGPVVVIFSIFLSFLVTVVATIPASLWSPLFAAGLRPNN